MGKKVLRSLLVLTCCLVCSGFRWSFVFGDMQWQEVEAEITRKYPGVMSISTDELQSILGRKEILLIDVREQEEFEVSHIPGAVLQGDVDLENFPEDEFVVAYCSVGLRSAAFVKKMQNIGFSNIYNLQGSIFEWANKGYRLQSGTRNVVYVHPYNERWGVLLNKELHNYGPGS